MDHRAPDSDLDLARRAARAAGAAVMRHFRRDPDVRFKSPDQPITDADLEADALLRRTLLDARPGWGWLSEETADSRARLACDRVWIVDPIDGTNSFVEGRPEFVVSVGLAVRGEAVLGVVYNPATEELYHATRGGGAFLNDDPIRVAPPPAGDERPVLLASRSALRRGEMEEYRGRWEIRPMGSTAYRMAKVAQGAGHLYRTADRRKEWDVCAAALIVTEAGGTATQADGAPFRFNQPEPVSRGVVASSGASLPGPGRRDEKTEETTRSS